MDQPLCCCLKIRRIRRMVSSPASHVDVGREHYGLDVKSLTKRIGGRYQEMARVISGLLISIESLISLYSISSSLALFLLEPICLMSFLVLRVFCLQCTQDTTDTCFTSNLTNLHGKASASIVLRPLGKASKIFGSCIPFGIISSITW